MTYSIGHHRFIEMARAAGAVYKIGEKKDVDRKTIPGGILKSC